MKDMLKVTTEGTKASTEYTKCRLNSLCSLCYPCVLCGLFPHNPKSFISRRRCQQCFHLIQTYGLLSIVKFDHYIISICPTGPLQCIHQFLLVTDRSSSI